MKKLVLYTIAALMIGAASVSAAYAQPAHKKAWKHRKEMLKKQREYHREHAKKRDEYYRERAKERDEYYRERYDDYDEYYDDDYYYDDDVAYRRGGPPPWAPAHGYRAKRHVYFPDYYTFYDAHRDGYVYWRDDAWAFSRRVPSFMLNVDLNRARIQVMGDIPLTRRPERYINDYARRYPRNNRVSVNLGVFIPLFLR